VTDDTSTGPREPFRARYAEAARVVLEPRPGVTAQCVEISAAGACCNTGSAALESAGCLDGLAAAGFADASLTFTNQAARGIHSAIIRAVRLPGDRHARRERRRVGWGPSAVFQGFQEGTWFTGGHTGAEPEAVMTLSSAAGAPVRVRR
jgi:hypothetical protein